VILHCGDLSYEWVEDWGHDALSGHDGAWPHHGIVTTRAGDLITFDPTDPFLLVLDPSGAVRSRIPAPFPEAHGITLVEEGGVDRLWLADAGFKLEPGSAYARPTAATPSGAVAKISLDGDVLLRLGPPPIPAYAAADYRPTSVAVVPGSGDVWVADGYGQSYIHRYDAAGAYQESLDGTTGSGRFKTPHFIYVDGRHGVAELYVCDRGNARIQVYGVDGVFRREIDGGSLAAPTWIAADGDRLVLVEFKPPRLTILDRDDRLVGYIAMDADAPQRAGWPNGMASDGAVRRYAGTLPGRLNSPHAATADARGDIYVTEWLIGGRITKLARVA
jgi:hypothetical protein